jgi:hydroxyethylthiazole kinase-like sugar kinase family protein
MNIFSNKLKSLWFRKTTACGCVITNLCSNFIAGASPPPLVVTQACLWYTGLGVHWAIAGCSAIERLSYVFRTR